MHLSNGRSSLGTAVLCAFLFAPIAGCSPSNFPVEKITGKVTCDGQPIPNVLVYFEPLRTANSSLVGQQGFGLTDASGSFKITTYNDGDGAVVGKHKIRVGKTETSPPCNCDLNPNLVLQEVEVKQGAPNDFAFSLLPKNESSNPPAMSDEEREKEMDKAL